MNYLFYNYSRFIYTKTNSMNSIQQTKWYNKTWLVIILTIFIFPIGLYGLWQSNVISQKWKYIGTSLVGLMIIIALTNADDNNSNKSKTSELSQLPINQQEDRNIPGLAPADVYLNMEKRGFVTKKTFTDEGNSWKCSYSYAGINYDVITFSQDVNSVEHVRATVQLNGEGNKSIIATKPFLKFVASVPFEGNDPVKVGAWLDQNFYKDKATYTISNVRYTIYAPTKFVRMLDIENN